MAATQVNRRSRDADSSASPTSPTRTTNTTSTATNNRPNAAASSSSNPSSLQCECGRTFTRVENLRRHRRSHEDSRRLACSICGRTFNRPDVLRRHMRTHRGPSTSAPSGDSPPHTAQSSVTSLTVDDGARRGSSGSSTHKNDLAPANFSGRYEDRRQDRRHHQGDLPSIDTLLPSSNVFDANTLRSRIPPSFPVDTPLPIPHLQQPNSGIEWDHSLLSLLQDTARDIQWRDIATLEGAIPASMDPTSGLSFHDVLDPVSRSSSHARFPQHGGTRGGDNWEHHTTKGIYVPGAEGTIDEVTVNPTTDPKLWPWSRFWLDGPLYDRVKSSLNLAEKTPGVDTSGFRMPESLYTVNTLISSYFNTFYAQLPILHLPTFSVSKARPLLLAAILCVGASTSHIPGARPFAVDLIEVIRRTLLAMHEMDPASLRTPDHVHVCLLNCLAGISIGHQRSFEVAELSRGMLAQLCRRMHLLHSPVDLQHLHSSLPSNPVERWHVWIDMESRKRLGLGIFLVDSMFPSYLDMPSYLSQGEMLSTALPCNERFWRAPNPVEWAALVGHHVVSPSEFFVTGISALLVNRTSRNAPAPIRHLDHFASLCLITALHHHICEYRSQLAVYQSIGVVSTFGHPDKNEAPPDLGHGFDGRRLWLEEALNAWCDTYYDPGDYSPLSVSGKVLYHVGHIALRIHLRDLYVIAGKVSSRSSRSVVPAIKVWVRSPDAPVAAEHALRMLSAIGFPQPSEDRLAAQSVFLAILVLWVFIKYHGAAIHQTFDTNDIMRLFGTVPSSYSILKRGMQSMVNNKTWKMNSALALALAKMLDRDEVPSPPILSPRSTRTM